MFYPAILINLFFVPVIPLYLYYKVEHRPLTPNLELLFQYCAVVSFNHVAAHAISFFLHKLTGVGFALDSARYTLLALLAAAGLFMVYIAITYLRPEIHISPINEHEAEENEKKETPLP